jgi:ABC-2 type transport system permease protein
MVEPTGPIGAVRLVAGREISTRLRSKAFKITTAVSLIVIVGAVVAFKLIGGGGGGGSQAVGFTPSTQALAAPLAAVARAVDEKITPSLLDETIGLREVRDGSLDALVTGTPDHFEVVVVQDLSPDLRAAFSVLIRQITLNNEIAKAGGDPEAVAATVDAASFAVRSLDETRDNQGPRLVVAMIVGMLVYLAVMMYGQLVAQGVVEEKASRIVEILLTTIRPWQLMLGKVLGVGLVGLLQMLLTVVIGVGAGLAFDVFTFPTEIATSAAVWGVVWFLLGYLMYAFLFAALGALVSRQEDVAGVTAPALMAIILPFVLAASILPADPDNQFLAVASQVPFFSPMIMPMRVALDVVPVWQLAVSVSLTVMCVAGLVWLSGRVYGNAVLRMGSRVSIRDALSDGRPHRDTAR